MAEIFPGDHVRVSRGLYWHHAIYVGQDEDEHFVVHFSDARGGKGKADATIRLSTWDVFEAGGTVQLVARPKNPNSAIGRALDRLGRSGYDLFKNNCEHFCTWVIEGKPRSEQVETLTKVAGVVGVFSFGLAILSVLSGYDSNVGRYRDSRGRFT